MKIQKNQQKSGILPYKPICLHYAPLYTTNTHTLKTSGPSDQNVSISTCIYRNMYKCLYGPTSNE